MGKYKCHKPLPVRLPTYPFEVKWRAIVKGVEMTGTKQINAPDAAKANSLFMYFIGNFVNQHPDCPPHTDDDMVEVWTDVYPLFALN